MRKSFPVTTLLSGLLGTLVSLHAQDAPDQAEQIRQLKEMVRLQNEAIQILQQRVDTLEKSVAVHSASAVPAPIVTQGSPPPGPEEKKTEPPAITLSSEIRNVRLTGDLRVRYEYDERVNNGVKQERDRFRPRFRLGGRWQGKENWEIGAGVATGDSSPTSTNDTYSDDDEFDTGDLRLDYAYARHRAGSWDLTIGQQPNPYIGTWVIWDSDVRPVGITLHRTGGPWFATGGGYAVRHYGRDEENASLAAFQLGVKEKKGDVNCLATLTWYYFNQATVDPNDAGSVQPSVVISDEDYTFNLGSVYLEAEYQAEKWRGRIFGEITHNFSAEGGMSQVGGKVDPGENDTAWILGTKLSLGRFSVNYAYAYIGADSVYGQLNDSTFGGTIRTTDIKGHVSGLSYKLTDNLTGDITIYLTDPIERQDREDGMLLQGDLTWKF